MRSLGRELWSEAASLFVFAGAGYFLNGGA